MEKRRRTWCHHVSIDSVDMPTPEEQGSYTVEGGGRLRKVKSKSRFEPMKVESVEDAQLEIQELNKSLSRQTPISSQTIDERGFERSEGDVTRSSFIKHNKTFHKIFLDIPEGEELTHAFTCALQKEVLYQGKLFVSDNYVCFYSSVLLKETRVVIHVSNVQAVKKQNTARVVPNALSIHTNEGEKYLFVSLRNREACYKLLCSVCPNVVEKSGQNSPVASSAENGIDPGKDSNSSESSLEDTPNHLDDRNRSVQLKAPLPKLIRTSRTRQSSSTSTENDESSSDENTEPSWIWSVTEKVKSLLILRESNNFNLLLCIYLLLVLLLVLTSGYIGLRIMALEEQLSSMGALPEFSLQSGYKDT
ncbi:GRAM domain-containing protein 2B-like isoform X2 [Anguilla anguilla]|uniref:GRAM domain-containing protein 2B-like isoform X2 n=1 Tax=Anguilla anguilla TaxID=7936 RepID=UPI0015B0459A|nr:GRAM domain-containing protein 2B-like isoform X2 [Anguilla anguilla]